MIDYTSVRWLYQNKLYIETIEKNKLWTNEQHLITHSTMIMVSSRINLCLAKTAWLITISSTSTLRWFISNNGGFLINTRRPTSNLAFNEKCCGVHAYSQSSAGCVCGTITAAGPPAGDAPVNARVHSIWWLGYHNGPISYVKIPLPECILGR